MRQSSATRGRIFAVVALCIVPVLVHVAIVETIHSRLGWPPDVGSLVKVSLVTASAVAHWTIYGSLLLTFALTLRPGHEALITVLARRLYGAIPSELAAYTRRVTWAWCCFFAAQLITSVTLFFFSSLVIWSFFVNIVDLPLVAAMFSAEYLCRLRCLRNPPRHSLAEVIHMIADVRKTGENRTSAP